MQKIKESTYYVTENAKFVKINEKRIDDFVNKFSFENRIFSDLLCNFTFRNKEEKAIFLFVYSWINFCFWGNVIWEFEKAGQYVGSTEGYLLALKAYLDKNRDFLSNGYISKMSLDDFRGIFKGKGELKLIEERFRLLKFGAEVFERDYNFDLQRLLRESGNDVESLIVLLVAKFSPIYDDKSIYRGVEVYFDKKAQVFLSYLSNLSPKEFCLHGVEHLTAFADYRLPQSLRHIGVLEYENTLGKKIDNLIELPFGSKEEIEIRASTIVAVERIKQRLSQVYSVFVSAREIDSFLWNYAKNYSHVMKPHHRTVSVFY